MIDDAPISLAERARRPSRLEEMIAMFAVTEADVAHIRETRFLYRNVIAGGHLIAIVGMPGAGKTTIMEYICGQLDAKVLYVNADISAGDLPEALRRADAGGYQLLAPDVKVGLSMDDVVAHLRNLANSEEDLAGLVLVIDTLKKVTSVISKGQAADMYKLLRKLTTRGATVVALGHCNKYPDQNGWPVYEGTADLRSDFDELALLHGHKGDYGLVTASLYWEAQGCVWAKARALVEPLTWIIDTEDGRTVSEQAEWVDTVALSKEARTALQTGDVIREVYALLNRHGAMTQTDILQRLEGIHGKHIIRRVLKQQADRAWTITQGEHNSQVHTAIPGADIPPPMVVDWGTKSRK